MEWYIILWHILAIIGCIKLSCYVLPLLYWTFFSCINLNQFLYGYVLITGATDGIGKAMAKEFLRRGFKIILVSRSPEKLQKVKSEFLDLYPQSIIELIAIDFSYSHRNPIKIYENFFETISNFNISILVNNVGSATVKLLNNETFENIESMIGVNVYPSTMITHQLIGVFLKRYEETKQKSLVINMGSTMEESIFPGNAVYSATKRYNAFFSEGLRYEYLGKIEFAVIKPGLVITPMVKKNKTQDLPLSTDPDTFARASLGGLRSGVNHGYWKHKILGFLLNFVPYQITIILVRLTIGSAIKKGLI
ncbi:hypothetical protein SteCoe_22392 [Stentor coeruleus]|uniref:Uncharacterized protein n=1 Tax=Stentor coeruleus TaxID=5963 RepID=A0A1R2BM99_9CILI|nr:hypothetical protein SteCoe_22392 [Stentor coeruleus]